MQEWPRKKHSDSDRLLLLIFLTIAIRLGFLLLQRLVGIDWDFHPDAIFYTNKVYSMEEIGLFGFIVNDGFENILFILVGFILRSLTFKVFDVSTLLILFNLFISVLTVIIIWRAGRQSFGKNKFFLVAIFYVISPYLCHISIHPLKDGLAIFLTLAMLFALQKDRILLFVFLSIFLVFNRYYFGLATTIAFIAWYIAYRLIIRGMMLHLLAIFSILMAFILIESSLAERADVEFFGRDFFYNGLALVPQEPFFRFVFGLFFNFLVPYPFVPSSFGEVGYFLHWLLFLIIIIKTINERKKIRYIFKKINRQPIFSELFWCCYFLFSFALATTPGAGPLVRYRLAVELLFLIAITGTASRTKRNA